MAPYRGPQRPNDKLRAARLARCLTQEQLAEELTQLRWRDSPGDAAMTAHMITRYETGRRRPGRVQQGLFCTFFEQTPAELGFLDWMAMKVDRKSVV